MRSGAAVVVLVLLLTALLHREPRFRIGDRVRFVRRVGPSGAKVYWSSAPPVGWEGVITDIDNIVRTPLRVRGQRFNSKSDAWWFAPEALEHVKPGEKT